VRDESAVAGTGLGAARGFVARRLFAERVAWWSRRVRPGGEFRGMQELAWGAGTVRPGVLASVITRAAE